MDDLGRMISGFRQVLLIAVARVVGFALIIGLMAALVVIGEVIVHLMAQPAPV